MQELEEKIRQLREMSATLSHLARACDGDGRPDCPILQGREGDPKGKGTRNIHS